MPEDRRRRRRPLPEEQRRPSPQRVELNGTTTRIQRVRQRLGLDPTEEEALEERGKELKLASEELLQKLFSYLSKLPEELDGEEEENTLDANTGPWEANKAQAAESIGGISLPASAVGWLSSCLFPVALDAADPGKGEKVPTNDPADSPPRWMGASLCDRLSLLRFLLPRATNIRITNDQWPRPKAKSKKKNPSSRSTPNQSNHRSMSSSLDALEGQDLNCSHLSVVSAITTDSVVQTQPMTMLSFRRYLDRLQHQPRIDLRVFPNVRILVLEQVSPTWVHNLDALQESLQVFRIHRGYIYSVPKLFCSRKTTRSQQARTEPEPQDQLAPPTETMPVYKRLTHIKFSDCRLDELSCLLDKPSPLSLCPALASLCLANNDLATERQALAGLRHLKKLSSLDLSRNRIGCLKTIYKRVSNLRALRLSRNQLVSTRGIDQLDTLQYLWIDNNNIRDVAQVAGLARLDNLKELWIHDNPFVLALSKRYRVDIWELFAERRLGPGRRTANGLNACLPLVDGRKPSAREVTYLCARAFGSTMSESALESVQSTSDRIIPRPSTNYRNYKVKRRQNARNVKIWDGTSAEAVAQVERRTRQRREIHEPIQSIKDVGVRVDFDIEDVLNMVSAPLPLQARKADDSNLDVQSTPIAHLDVAALTRDIDAALNTEGLVVPDSLPEVEENLEQSEKDMASDIVPSSSENQTNNTNSSKNQTDDKSINNSEEDLAPSGPDDPETDNQTLTASNKSPDRQAQEKKGAASVKLYPGANERDYSIFSQEWDDLVKQVAGGMFPNPTHYPIVDVIANADERKPALFSEAIDLLPPAESEKIKPVPMSMSTQISLSTQSGYRSNGLPDHIWEDDGSSIPSSLGASRDDPSTLNKFQIAEENSFYDGPDYYKDFVIASNIDLYFQVFVFSYGSQGWKNEIVDLLSCNETFRYVSSRVPRIQLCHDDQKWFELKFDSEGVQDSEQSILRESLVRVWHDAVVPCGRLALRRLLANRTQRLGFHGDLLFADGNADIYSQARNVILCLSSTALYFIVDHDKVSQKMQEKRKKFPVPMPEKSKFRDASWPHAAARHELRDLSTIVIGFGFQRITLNFAGPAGTNDNFTYVVHTANKMKTVALLQDIQKLAERSADPMEDHGRASAASGALRIENDDPYFLEALAVAVAPEPVGIVLHYQILAQRWKHGDRGLVRRVVIVTDSKMYLLDEDYIADGSDPKQVTLSNPGNVKFKVVDEAALLQVAEVQAAGTDPKAITIVINGASRLSRVHRWRLVCRDGEGAEALVADVRKALKMAASA